jgi:hypothetical protein
MTQENNTTVETFTHWHVVVWGAKGFSDFQIETTFPFFNLAKIRGAIQSQVQSPVSVVNWKLLTPEEYANSVMPTESANPVETLTVDTTPEAEATPAPTAKTKKKKPVKNK